MAAGTGSRRPLGFWLAGTVLAAAVVFGNAQPASACVCAVTPARALEEATAVFTGVVQSPGRSDAGGYLLAVDQVFKGQVHERQWVVADDACGTVFDGSGAHFVVAWNGRTTGGDGRSDDDWYTDHCLGTASLSDGLPGGLGQPSPPLPGTSPAPGDEGTPTWQVAAGAAAGVSVIAAGAFGLSRLARRRRDAPAG